MGPHTDRAGPCTLLLSGVATPPEQLVAWLPRSPVFAALVVRLYQLGPSASRAARTAATCEAVLEQITAAGPPLAPVRLQCSPRSLEVWFAERLPPAWQLAVTGFGHVLNVARLGERTWRHWTHPAALLYQYPPDGPQRVPSQLSKAAGKRLCTSTPVPPLPLELQRSPLRQHVPPAAAAALSLMLGTCCRHPPLTWTSSPTSATPQAS